MPAATLFRPLPPPLAAATRWTLDPSASSVEFRVRQFWGLSTVHGRFDRFEGDLELRPDGTGRAELRIEAASLHTGNRRRDKHLRTPDYFDCERHPLVRFAGAVVPASGGALKVTGELEAAGRSIVLVLAATVEHAAGGLELAAGATIDARELGMTWSPAGQLRTPVALAVRACLRPEA
jgi:polyisoprenoid-binding protein YceI